MNGPEEARSVDELLTLRESLRERGAAPTFDQLCQGTTVATRDELARRLADVTASERALELSRRGPPPELRRAAVAPLGKAGRYESPRVEKVGGMGVLCAADDLELGRVVAYKVMKPGLHLDPEARERFFLEAEITAKLVHPGIVPVLGRVTDDSGLPAYATEYVHGDTLVAGITRLHALPPTDHPARAEARVELLRAFIAACRIVAFAHSRNVVHGDIKPSNIMIDEYGGTRVIDWGVARELGPDERNGDRQTIPWRAGTPLFISSPHTRATFASDVYALGLTLRWMLSNRPLGVPWTPTPAPDTPPALWAVAEQAMNQDHDARYRSPTDLAADVQAVLDDRPVAAYRDPRRTRLRRWLARHATGAAVALVLFATLAVAGPIVGYREWWLRQQADTARLRAVKLTDEMLAQAELVGKFQATLPGSKAILGRAVRLINQLARDGEANGTDLRPVIADYHRAGLIHLNLNQLPEADACFLRSSALAERRFATAPNDAANRNLWASALREWGASRHAQGDTAAAAKAWDQALALVSPIAGGAAAPEHRWTLARIHQARGNHAMQARDQPRAQAEYQRALDLAEALTTEAPDDARYLKTLADVESNLGISLALEALPDGRRLVAPDRLARATDRHLQALRHRRRLARLEPGKPEFLADVASSLNHLGNARFALEEPDFAEAEASYREALSIFKALTIAYPGASTNRRDLAFVSSNLNVLLTRQNRTGEAVGLARESIDLFTRLIADHPEVAGFHEFLGVAREQLAENLKKQSRASEAAAETYAAATSFARALTLTDEPKARANLTKRALALLQALGKAGFFQDPARAASLRSESVFDGLRTDPDFPRAGTPDEPETLRRPEAPIDRGKTSRFEGSSVALVLERGRQE